MKYFLRRIGSKVEVSVDGRPHAQLFTNPRDALAAEKFVTGILSQIQKKEAANGSPPEIP